MDTLFLGTLVSGFKTSVEPITGKSSPTVNNHNETQEHPQPNTWFTLIYLLHSSANII
jgi:hypothetical protein